jgi:hypothetical protein
MVQHKQYKKGMRYGTANVCQDNFIKNRGGEGGRSLTYWVWFRCDEEGNASEKCYELFHGREMIIFVGNMWYTFLGINLFCAAYLVYT